MEYNDSVKSSQGTRISNEPCFVGTVIYVVNLVTKHRHHYGYLEKEEFMYSSE